VEHDLVPRVDELERCREPGEPAADDPDPQKNDPTTMRSFFGTERLGLPLKMS
jgi:hypothetical protein